ncbi:ATP-binding protein [Streptomyces rubellomurinus]|uniref:ATP-binding protein n=1 Tax=Streptomyces rubellomurinus (strain ATCC 31215) TaxID=359131 RepID=UPI000698725C|nr:ATP-binding protein [Streptomyces rubellomurinus]
MRAIIDLRFQFPADRRSVSTARQRIGQALRAVCAAPDDERIADTLLVFSELANNAVLHACDGGNPAAGLTAEVRLCGNGTIRVSVADPDPRRPIPRKAAEDEVSGRGLALVTTYADRFGVEDLGPRGKRVWAELLAHASPSQPPGAAITAAARKTELLIAQLHTGIGAQTSLSEPAVIPLSKSPVTLDRIPAA